MEHSYPPVDYPTPSLAGASGPGPEVPSAAVLCGRLLHQGVDAAGLRLRPQVLLPHLLPEESRKKNIKKI